MKANQKLDFITKGLSVYASLAFDARFDNTINRSKEYMVYEYTGKMQQVKIHSLHGESRVNKPIPILLVIARYVSLMLRRG